MIKTIPHAGISLPPSLKAAVNKIAKKRGLTLSAFTVAVFTEIVNEGTVDQNSQKVSGAVD